MKQAMKLVVSIACAMLGAATALAVALPDGYTPLDYIQGDGTAALILTDYTPVPALDRVKAKFELTSTSANSSIFCSRGNNTTVQTYTLFYVSTYEKLRYDYNSNVTDGYFDFTAEAGKQYTVAITNNIACCTPGAATVTHTAASYAAGGPLMLFASYYNGTDNNRANFSNHRLYSLSVVRSNDRVMRNYVPCRQESDGEVGLYETVTGTFLGNANSSGAFVAGPESTFAAVDPGAQNFTGQVAEPVIEVVNPVSGTLLSEGSDYTVAYENNDWVGVGKAVVTGIGTYEGMKDEVLFNIVSDKILPHG